MSQGQQGPVVQAQHLWFSYGDVPVLRDCTFRVAPGSFTVLAGQNGSGKSTFVQLLIGQLSPTRGSIELLGTKPVQFHAWKRLGYVPQDGAGQLQGFPATVEEVVRSGLYADRGLWRPLGKEGHRAVERALQWVGLHPMAKHKVSELSGGQRQRVLLARALSANPDLLILDEPTANIDDNGAEAFFQLVSGMRHTSGHLNKTLDAPGLASKNNSVPTRKLRSILMVTHDLGNARAFADEILVLEDGSTHKDQ